MPKVRSDVRLKQRALLRWMGMVVVPVACLLSPVTAHGADPLPDRYRVFLATHCLSCHDADSQEGGVTLDFAETDWSRSSHVQLWERIHRALRAGEMPPAESESPPVADRRDMVQWIESQLIQHVPIGGTPARRLNQLEYQATVAQLFDLPDFSLPAGFPVDREHHGFDNLGEGLVLSAPLLEAYTQTATLIADQIFPPPSPLPVSARQRAEAQDLVISYSSAKRVGDALRLGLKCDPIMRSCTWPSRIEAEQSARYRLTLELSAFRPRAAAEPMKVKILARDVSSKDSVRHGSLRLLEEIQVTQETPQSFSCEVELYAGQTPVVHWANAPLDSDREDKAVLAAFFKQRDQELPGYLAAWQAMLAGGKGQGFRGGIGWQRVQEQRAREDLPELTPKQEKALLKKITQNPVLYAETVVFDVFEHGPSLQVHSIQLEGPLQLIDGPSEREQRARRERFLGEHASPAETIRVFLTRAFRRPVDDATLQTYLGLYERHLAAGHTRSEAFHLVIRNVLISPRFLYRCLAPGALDEFDLATRLAYFLTGEPPDDPLMAKASAGVLADPDILRGETERLLPRNPAAALVVNFTEQWLDTRLLADIMPDPKFAFTAADVQSAKLETEHFFLEMLRENRPLTDFIDPDFTWTSARLAKNVYGLKRGFKNKAKAMQRVPLPRGGRYGGILGQAAVMMATANGVDTQPVLRGVWVLENVLGTPTPPPPNAVPPITPDTTGATSPRDLLQRHTQEAACAACHRQIDPLGLVLENFDPVGRWRDSWPQGGQPIEAVVRLPDGTTLNDVRDLKAWFVRNIEQFSVCLSEKLMTYATGRVPNFAERQEIQTIVRAHHAEGGGFRDLVMALIQSQTFRTK